MGWGGVDGKPIVVLLALWCITAPVTTKSTLIAIFGPQMWNVLGLLRAPHYCRDPPVSRAPCSVVSLAAVLLSFAAPPTPVLSHSHSEQV